MWKQLSLLALAVAAAGIATGCGDDDDSDNSMTTANNGSASADGGSASGSAGDSADGGSAGGDAAGGDDGGSTDNVSACNSLVDKLDCGGVDLGMFIPCDQYGNLTCDITDYFNCVEEAFECTDGMFDASAITPCASMAACS